ncbi:hypothetical protein [Maliponia aquimaris]|jgi:hypothetical protein|uniref:Uncharacterized protein n=1 Tax=Maliponia aquimaris TaxID=1673631 RepID=A0A238K9U4_9RHOB|nr:hypothetical protein [Maliponia aquimaris]SMX39257.1 hypothetical protein MAA8898_01955 [Maliponia aquimaris]
MQILTPLALALTFASPALAWEHTVEWRFNGAEIKSFKATDPEYDEDPALLEVTLSDPHSGDTVVTIEADNDIAPCAELLGYAQGNPFETVVLTANLNAQTLNGVTLAQCSTR